jgi:hypothetical protein
MPPKRCPTIVGRKRTKTWKTAADFLKVMSSLQSSTVRYLAEAAT